MPDGTGTNQGQRNTGHSPEILSESPPATGLQAFREAAEQVGKDPNAEYTAEMVKLDKEKLPENQEEGLYYLDKQLIDMIVANPDIDAKDLGLMDFIFKVRNIQNREQAIAVQKIKEIMVNPANPLAHELVAMWPATKKEGIDVRGGWGKRYLRHLKEKPLETVIYTVAGAAGIYLGIKAIKWLLGKAWDKTKEEASSILSPGNILATLGLSAFGAYQGRNTVANWLYEQFGLKFGKEKMEEVTNSIKNGKIPPELEGIVPANINIGNAPSEARTALENLKAEAEKKKEGIKEGAKEVQDNGILALLGIEKEDPEKRKEYTGFKDFILSQNPSLEVKTKLFSYIADKKYEDFLAQAPSFLDRAFEGLRVFDDIKDKNIDEERFKAFLLDYKASNLAEFFTTMLKNDGDFDEFKGKTIAEVMHLIQNNPDKYLDKEAVAKANEKNKHFENFKSEMAKLKKNPSLIKDRDFQANLIAQATQGGATLILDHMEQMAYWVADNGMAGAMVEAALVYKSLNIIADEAMESKSHWLWAGGAYLHIGAYTAAIGAPLGAIMGTAKTLMQTKSWTLALIKGVPVGSVKGIWHGLMFPLDIAKGGAVLGKDWMFGGEKLFAGPKPATQLISEINRQLFIFEDLSFGFFGKKALGMKSLPDKILKGEVEISKRLIEKLETYKALFHNQAESYTEMVKKGSIRSKTYQDYISLYEKAEQDTKKILETLEWKNNNFNEQKWFDKMKDLFNKTKMDDAFISDFAKNNKRLGLLLLNEDYPLRKFLLTPGNEEKAGRLIQALTKNSKLLDKLVQVPEIIEDEEVIRIS